MFKSYDNLNFQIKLLYSHLQKHNYLAALSLITKNMATKLVKRAYSFSDGTLVELGNTLTTLAERDITEMTAYGYDQPRIDGIRGKINAFKTFAPDEYFTGQLMIASEAKNTSIKQMGELSESIVRRAMNKFGKNSDTVKSFGWVRYITKTDAHKISVNRLVHKVATDNLAALVSEGLTAGILADLEFKVKTATGNLVAQKMKKSARDAAVHQRIGLGNDLYAELVKLANTGKHIFEDLNRAKYNHYVIYRNQPNTETVTGTVIPATTHQPSVTVDSASNKITVEIKSGELLMYFSDDPTNEPAAGQKTVTITPARPFRGNAAQLDWSETNFRLLLQNTHSSNAVSFTVVVRE